MKTTTLISTLLVASAASAISAPALATGNVHVDARLRYESVEQTGKLDAEAVTLRTRLGWTSPEIGGFTFLGEVENVIDLDVGDRNSGLNGQSQFATIKDDDNTELQRFQVSGAIGEHWSVVLGRQNLGFDTGRFIGSPGWRQDKNTHDAALVRFSAGDFTASYVYHWQVNRGPGDDFDWETDSHLFHLGMQPMDTLHLSAFAYLIDLTDPAAPQNQSNATFGLRVAGEVPLGEWALGYNATAATQTDYGSADLEYDLGYLGGEVSLARDGWSVRAGAEMIEGNGDRSVANPLAANHGTAGWADAIHGGGAMGPADGVALTYIGGRYGNAIEDSWLQSYALGFTAWSFDFERTGNELGEELDLFAEFGLTDAMKLHLQYADFDGVEANGAPADRIKSWVYLTYRR